jgi:hypothetical protein
MEQQLCIRGDRGYVGHGAIMDRAIKIGSGLAAIAAVATLGFRSVLGRPFAHP